MATIVIANVRQARILAAYYGMDVPEGQGRFPIQRLAEIATDRGDQLDLSNYHPGSDMSHVGQTRYRVTALVAEDHHVVPRETTITVAEIREWSRRSGRGRVSKKDIAEAAVAKEEWNATEIVDAEKL